MATVPSHRGSRHLLDEILSSNRTATLIVELANKPELAALLLEANVNAELDASVV